MFVYTSLFVSVCMLVFTQACIIYLCVYVCLSVYICVCHVYMYVCAEHGEMVEQKRFPCFRTVGGVC